jgi:type IV secretory pathway VirB3-like protein
MHKMHFYLMVLQIIYLGRYIECFNNAEISYVLLMHSEIV